MAELKKELEQHKQNGEDLQSQLELHKQRESEMQNELEQKVNSLSQQVSLKVLTGLYQRSESLANTYAYCV